MMSKTVVVAGAGVVGLSVARAVARRAGMDVIVLEANTRVGMETSSRNSEVIHAGIYYPKDSLKAQLCVRGRDLLYEYCESHSVPHKRCGKLIVAQAHQVDQLAFIAQRGIENGVNDLRMISKETAQRLEPEVKCEQAIFSPSTGIVDSHAFMQSLHGDAEYHGAVFAFATSVDTIESSPRAPTVKLTASSVATGETYEMECDYFINATGIFAPRLVKTTQRERPAVSNLFAKGTYFKLRDNFRPFSHLVYPIPEIGGLGVHSTVDIDGNVRFGPDVQWVSSVDYTPDETRAEVFADRIREYWPRVTSENLYADYCGIRPKITMGGIPFDDFYIAGEKMHGVKGVIHLCGIESPGLTSSLAIAEAVLALLNE